MIVGKSEYERPVAPGPPENRVSPENNTPASGTWNTHEPGECPGVFITSIRVPAISNFCPSDRSPCVTSGWVSSHSI